MNFNFLQSTGLKVIFLKLCSSNFKTVAFTRTGDYVKFQARVREEGNKQIIK